MHKVKDATENYLEAILILEEKEPRVRSIELSKHLGVSRASVSTAVKKLSTEGYIKVAPNGVLLLTEKGRNLAEIVYDRHCLLRSFLLSIGVSEACAERDACRLEHALSEESHKKLKEYVAILEKK